MSSSRDRVHSDGCTCVGMSCGEVRPSLRQVAAQAAEPLTAFYSWRLVTEAHTAAAAKGVPRQLAFCHHRASSGSNFRVLALLLLGGSLDAASMMLLSGMRTGCHRQDFGSKQCMWLHLCCLILNPCWSRGEP